MSEPSKGYSKEEYFSISSKKKLSPRCPILRKCCRAVWSRYVLGFKLGGSSISFDQFVSTENQVWNPDEMIKEIEQLSWTSKSDVICQIENCCPEIPLFETQYLPFFFKQSAFESATYLKESRTFECVPKHFSECAEFSEFIFQQTSKTTRKRSPISNTQRFEILHRDDFTCFYCKRHKDELPTGVTLTLDHKIPYSDGGDDSQSNLVTACSDCNSGKCPVAVLSG